MLGLAELVPGHSRGISVVSSDIVTVVGRGTEKKNTSQMIQKFLFVTCFCLKKMVQGDDCSVWVMMMTADTPKGTKL